jgi:hypothetical protein
MSNKRESAIETNQHLQHAEHHLQQAEKSASGTGDATLQKTVKRLKEETATTHTEIERKMGSQQGG